MSEVNHTTLDDQVRRRRRQKLQRPCPECDQTFSKAEHLARHIRSHTRERPFQCQPCGKTYSRHDSLLRHSRTHLSTVGLGTGLSPPISPTQETITSPMDEMSFDEDVPVAHSPLKWQSLSGMAASRTSQHSTNQFSEGTHSAADSSAVMHSQWPSTSTGSGVQPGSVLPIFSAAHLDYTDVEDPLHDPPWLLGNDFDFSSFVLPMSTSLSEWGQMNSTEASRYAQFPSDTVRTSSCVPDFQSSTTSNLAVQQQWFTRFSRNATTLRAAAPSGQDEVDDTYREGLAHRLQPPTSHATLPSAGFLNLCIRLYFAKFSPAFPIIHAPSFRPSQENALLLLSICSIGALLVGSSEATAQGRRIFQTLNKAVLASWENYLGRDPRETLSLLQAVVLGQTFGMLSGQSQDLCMTESFHGTAISWARQSGFFRAERLAEVSLENGQDVNDAWNTWAHNEECIRLVSGLHIHDSDFSTTFHHEPLLRHAPGRVALGCSDELFSAPTAPQWRAMLNKAQSTESPSHSVGTHIRLQHSGTSHIYGYTLLAGVLAVIQETRLADSDNSYVQNYRQTLLQWYTSHSKHAQESKHGYSSLMILWHTAFITLYADIDLLERFIGRDGDDVKQQVTHEARTWANSPNARLGILHALLVRRNAETMSYGVEPSIHIPKALFYSGVLVYCFVKLGLREAPSMPQLDPASFEEFKLSASCLSPTCTPDGIPNLMFSPVDLSVLCSCIDLLRRIGHWGISQKYASILEILLGDMAQ